MRDSVGGQPETDEPTTGLDRDLVDRTVDELRRHVDDPGDAAAAGPC
ncbi:hypothetical protein BJ965_001777 [Streptomyces luteogriseus]|uniref:Uncharacterized protein n=1 Tax=Streptomyces luteogriseus TaxID=68233 RepID=A0A7W7DJV6_9ACTN|nr:hypothetical protein [Streptomyces luteogriseus]